MKTYSNKTDRIDERKCLYSEIKKGDKARKKANRTEAKNKIIDDINDIIDNYDKMKEYLCEMNKSCDAISKIVEQFK